MLFIAIIIGVVAALVFYSSTMTSYKKAGAGQTYSIDASTDISLTSRSDLRTGTRSKVDHGFYSGSVSAAGRSEAYRMPQSVKQSIQQAQAKTGSMPAARPPQHRPPQSHPPRPDHMAGQHGMGGPRGSGRR